MFEASSELASVMEFGFYLLLFVDGIAESIRTDLYSATATKSHRRCDETVISETVASSVHELDDCYISRES